MRKKIESPIPEFRSPEAEKEFWESQGPLTEGIKGRVNRAKPEQTRSSYLAVRLTGEELTKLRDIANEQGIGPSTFARSIILAAIERKSKYRHPVTTEEITSAFENLSPSIKELAAQFSNETTFGDPDNPQGIVAFSHQLQAVLPIFNALISEIVRNAQSKTSNETSGDTRITASG